MRADLFQDKKCIHIQLEKEVHSEFRKVMFEYGTSMQETMNEFAKRLAERDSRAISLLERYIKEKLHADLKRMQNNEPKPSNKKISELDHEALYDLIKDEE